MTVPQQKVLESKRKLRRELAARSIGEKLRILEAMRDGALGIRPGEDTKPRIRAK